MEWLSMSDDDDYRDVMEILEPTRLWDRKGLKIQRSFNPDHKLQLIELMHHGHTFAGALGRMGIPISTGRSWLPRFPDWLEAKEIGEQCRLAKLEIALNKSATGTSHSEDEDCDGASSGDLRAIMFSLKAVHRHEYAEKLITESTESNTDANRSEEDIDAQISRQLKTIRDSIGPGEDTPAETRSPRRISAKKKPSS